MKYKKIVVLTYGFYDFERKCVSIGGLETYVKDLIGLKAVLNCDLVVYQLTSNNLVQYAEYRGARIFQYYLRKKDQIQKAFDDIYGKENDGASFFIIAAEIMNVKTEAFNVATIQHGIYIDAPDDYLFKNKKLSTLLKLFYRHYRCYKEASRLRNIKNLVCVDYNYFNWYRTLGDIPKDYRVKVIPNHISESITLKELKEKLTSNKEHSRIVFARRFVDFRGTLIFIEVAERLMKEIPNVEITFAGEGPLHDTIVNRLSSYPAFHITSFESPNSITFHKNYDIAVVPSIYSEGTSLSLLESMAAGCFPIASHVGGMTNIILDGFNGKLFYPNEDSLYSAIIDVLNLPNERFNEISGNAYRTCIEVFGKEKWINDWAQFITDTDK